MEKTETKLERVLRKNAERRRAVALLRAKMVIDRLRSMGIEAEIIGSLASNGFHVKSDVDFLVKKLADPTQRYAIESMVEDVLKDIPFDVVYADELRWHG
ncbi:MAG: hypothetical protein JJ714_05595 [Acidithiobacillus sp.]|nr:hypothetical protein [Acidithiobacillus sp.]